MDRRSRDAVESRSIPLVRGPTNGKIITIAKMSPRSEGSEPHIRPPRQASFTGKKNPQNFWL